MKWFRLITILSFSLLFILKLAAQKCNCKESFQFVSSWIEKNSPSFEDQIIKTHKESDYQKFKEKMLQLSEGIGKDSFSCMNLIAQYFHYFRDQHLQINYKPTFFNFDDDDTIGTMRFFRKFPHLYGKRSKDVSNPLLGYWKSKDGSFIFEIVKDKSLLHDMVGRVVIGDSMFWEKDHIKLEIKKSGNKNVGVFWVASRQPRAYDISLVEDSVLKIGHSFVYYRSKGISDYGLVSNFNELPNSFSFSKLSDSTCYLRIPSFYDVKEKVEALIKNNLTSLTSTPNLIIDIRNNGGGSDDSYYPLFPFLFTTNEVEEPYFLATYATKGNYEANKNQIYQFAHNKKDSLKFDAFITKLKRNLGHYTQEQFGMHKIDTLFGMPIKVAIIDNAQCGSSAEGFVMYAKESPKVKIYGENTFGAYSYGNVRFHDVPGLPIVIGVPTSKAMFKHKYLENRESIGIAPDIYLNSINPLNWVSFVQKDMEKKE